MWRSTLHNYSWLKYIEHAQNVGEMRVTTRRAGEMRWTIAWPCEIFFEQWVWGEKFSFPFYAVVFLDRGSSRACFCNDKRTKTSGSDLCGIQKSRRPCALISTFQPELLGAGVSCGSPQERFIEFLIFQIIWVISSNSPDIFCAVSP